MRKMNRKETRMTLSGCMIAALMMGSCFGTSLAEAEEDTPVSGVYTVAIEKMEAQYASAEYPVVTGVEGYSQESLDTINAYFKEQAEQAIAEQEPLLEETLEELKEIGSDSQVGYEITCDHIYLDGDLLSVMQYSFGYWGGAHGYGYRIGHSFDLASGAELSMGELLGCDEATAQERVVNAYRQDIIGQVDMITEDAIWNAFGDMAYWRIEEGMVVDIPQDVVACYAAGPQTVLVPLDGSAGGSYSRIMEGLETENEDADDTITVINGIQADASDFIFPYSSTVLLSEEDLTRLEGGSVEEEHYKSQLAINEILARYGYVFYPENGGASEEAYNQFAGKAWYEEAKAYCPTDSANEMLYTYINDTELENVERICEWQKAHNCYY